MKTETIDLLFRMIMLGTLLLGIVVGWIPSVHGAGVFESLIETHKEAVRSDIQEAIRQAEMLTNEGKYIEALRLLFDANKKEERWLVSDFMKDNEEFQLLAINAILSTEYHFIHNDQSPLMQWFRDSDISLEERLEALTELQQLATQKVRRNENLLFRGKYNGMLVDLVTSSQLRLEEKKDVLWKLYHVIQESYTSPVQKERIIENIAQLKEEAEQRFQAQQYIEAFILIDKAMQKAREIEFFLISQKDYMHLLQHRVDIRKRFVHVDESSLMQVFKNQQIPTKERQYLLYSLRDMLTNRSISGDHTIILQEHEYDGIFAQILTHPEIEWDTKESLLVSIEVEILKKEPDYTPDWLLPPKE